ncbi:MAG: hypothetical protein U0R51_07350 [Solirubrobacterales bacterium]
MTRVLPKSVRGRVLTGLGLLVIAAAIAAGLYYFNEVPEKLADDYRADAGKAADGMTSGMDRVNASFDRYLAVSTVPRRSLENAEDVAELRRRILPVLDDTDATLRHAEEAIDAERKRIKRAQAPLRDVPSSWMLDDSDPLSEAAEVVEINDAYRRAATPYLRDFERFARYDRRLIDVIRRTYAPRPIDELAADAPIETLKSTVADEVEFNAELRHDLLALKPPADAKELHEQAIEELNVVIDYYEDIQTGLEQLSVPALEQADADLLSDTKRLRDRGTRYVLEFAANSSLQKQSRRLDKRGDELEDRIATLGTGDGDRLGNDHFRPVRPKPPADGKGGGSGGDDQTRT